MNKKIVDRLLPAACQELKNRCLDKNGKLPSGLRGQIASFGAAVSTGSLLAAAAFFNDQGGANTERHKLMEAINSMLKAEKLLSNTGETLFDTIKCNGSNREIKEKVLNCAVALKLAMNLFELKKTGEEDAS